MYRLGKYRSLTRCLRSLTCSPSTFRRAVATRDLPALRIGPGNRLVRVDRAVQGGSEPPRHPWRGPVRGSPVPPHRATTQQRHRLRLARTRERPLGDPPARLPLRQTHPRNTTPLPRLRTSREHPPPPQALRTDLPIQLVARQERDPPTRPQTRPPHLPTMRTGRNPRRPHHPHHRMRKPRHQPIRPNQLSRTLRQLRRPSRRAPSPPGHPGGWGQDRWEDST